MRLPTSYLHGKTRSAIRFTVVGTTGMLIQTWFFVLILFALDGPEKGTPLYYVAFTLGYLMELVPNYLMTNWYTFGTRPNWKNAGGFALARVFNLVIQLGLLPIMISLLPWWRDDYISFVVIFIGGCINYLICLLFFKKKEENQNPQ